MPWKASSEHYNDIETMRDQNSTKIQAGMARRRRSPTVAGIKVLPTICICATTVADNQSHKIGDISTQT